MKKFSKLVCISTLALASLSSAQVYAVDINNNLPVFNSATNATYIYDKGKPTSNAANSKTLTVNVTGNVANLDCESFNIAAGRTVNTVFGTGSKAAIYKVTSSGSEYASNIYGKMTQKGAGTVFLINPNGILFGNKASIKLGSFLASTHNGNTSNLSSFNLSRSGSATGITIQPKATVETTGDLVLASNSINNQGSIKTGKYGDLFMFAADSESYSLDDTGNFSVDSNSSYSSTENAKINHTGKISAGGNLNLEVYTNKDYGVDNTIVNLDGVISANDIFIDIEDEDNSAIVSYISKPMTAKSSITAYSDDTLRVTASNIAANNNLYLSANALDLSSNGTISAKKGSILIFNDTNDLIVNKTMSANTDLGIFTGSNLTANRNLSAKDNLTISTNGNQTINGALSATNDLEIVSGGNITINNKLSSNAGNVGINASGIVNTRDINAKQGIIIGSLIFNDIEANPVVINTGAQAGITTGNIKSGQNIVLTTTGNVNIVGGVTAKDDVAICTPGNISIAKSASAKRFGVASIADIKDAIEFLLEHYTGTNNVTLNVSNPILNQGANSISVHGVTAKEGIFIKLNGDPETDIYDNGKRIKTPYLEINNSVWVF